MKGGGRGSLTIETGLGFGSLRGTSRSLNAAGANHEELALEEALNLGLTLYFYLTPPFCFRNQFLKANLPVGGLLC